MKANHLISLAYILLAFVISTPNIAAQSNRIHTYEVQGTGNQSPYVGQIVSLDTAVVTYADNNRAYIQDLNGDNNLATSDGLLIDGGNTFQLSPGDRVLISGRVSESQGQTAIGSSISINKLSSGQTLAPTFFDPLTAVNNGVSPHERYEGMLVAFDIIAASGSNDFNSIKAYANNTTRPFREPGLLAPGAPNLPEFDGNPELFNYDPNGLGQNNFIFYNAGDQISGIGIMEQFSFGYELSPIDDISYSPKPVVVAARARTDEEISIGSLNTLFLVEDESNYQLHLTKIVNYISDVMHYPDVIALQEIGGSNEIEDLLFRLRQTDPELGNYSGYAPSSNGFLELGFLVHNRIQSPTFSILGNDEFFSRGGILHNRFPTLVTFEVPGSDAVPLQVLNIHIRSLNGIDTDQNVRLRRHEQAVSIANMVQELRNDNLVIVGDYNAYQFTDGYVDVYNQISGQNSLGAQIAITPIVSPPLQAAADLLEEEERYSFVFQGSAQQIDHCLHNQLSSLSVNDFEFARGNADASVNLANNTIPLARASDHDGFVLFLGIDQPSSTDNNAPTNATTLNIVSPTRAGQLIEYQQLPLGGSIQLYNASGQFIVSLISDNQFAGAGTFNLPSNLSAGTYFIRISQGKQLVGSRRLIIQ